MAKICIDYERDVKESQWKPANLLDALERGDRRREDDSNAAEEAKVTCLLNHKATWS